MPRYALVDHNETRIVPKRLQLRRRQILLKRIDAFRTGEKADHDAAWRQAGGQGPALAIRPFGWTAAVYGVAIHPRSRTFQAFAQPLPPALSPHDGHAPKRAKPRLEQPP